jgi:hypothetical protein
MVRALAVAVALGACTPPVEPPVHAQEHARPRPPLPPTIPDACEPSFIAVGLPDIKPVAVGPGQTAEVVTCKLQRGEDDGDFEWRAYLAQRGPRKRADRIDEQIGGVGYLQEGAASAWISGALPVSPIVFVEHASVAMDHSGHSFIAYRLDTDPPQLLHTFSGGEAELDVTDGVATIRTCSSTLEQHDAGDSCIAHAEQVSTATVRWTDGALAIDEHPAAKP